MSMPRYAQDALYGTAESGVNPFKMQQGISGVAGLIGGLFGNSGSPYNAAMDQYNNFLNQAKDTQNPFYTAGTNAIPQYQNWLQSMSNPTDFINHIMGQYQQSPYAKFQQQQGIRAAQNLGSATGLTGSTPLQFQAQQNAQNISSQDMNTWLQNVLGINSNYGSGLNSLIGTGQNSANALTNLLGDYGKNMAEASYGEEAGDNQDFFNTLAGGASLAAAFL